MKILTLLLAVTMWSIWYFDLTDTSTNLYLNPMSFLGLVIVTWFLLGAYKLVRKIVTKLNQIK
tara:strand:+ start:1036 stop:1224 length:189 start_codon:yes stop_codon:yes gene_type:complete